MNYLTAMLLAMLALWDPDGTALTVIGGQLVFLVKKSGYYTLTTTSTLGAPTFTVVGLVQELSL